MALAEAKTAQTTKMMNCIVFFEGVECIFEITLDLIYKTFFQAVCVVHRLECDGICVRDESVVVEP